MVTAITVGVSNIVGGEVEGADKPLRDRKVTVPTRTTQSMIFVESRIIGTDAEGVDQPLRNI